MTREEYKKHIDALSLHLTYPELDHLHAINDHDAEQRAEIARLQTINESWRNITQEEMCYTMMEVEALGIDFKKAVVDDGRALWDVCIDRIAELRKCEEQIARLREALKNIYAIVMGECPALLHEDSGGDAGLCFEIENILKETP